LTTARAALFKVHALKVNFLGSCWPIALRAIPLPRSLSRIEVRAIDGAVVIAKVIAMAEFITAAADGLTSAHLLLPLLQRKRAAMSSKPEACARG
jgi:hypothetical protein